MNDREIFEKLKMNIAINNVKQEFEEQDSLKNHRRYYVMKKKWIFRLCAMFILVLGIGVRANYDRIIATFGLGKGIESAVDNGYIAETNMNNVESNSELIDKGKGIKFENISVGTKIEDFLMDDLNISTHFNFQIDSKINDSVDLNDLKSIELNDLIVTDENNNILFCMNKEVFEEYCKENNLDYQFNKFNKHYYNCGLNTFITNYNKENGIIKFCYNMYTDNENYPKSKKLNFKFSTITLKRNDYLENENSIVNIKGNWNMEFDVPKEMYNRQSISYKVISCDEPDFEITNATVSNTGFEIGIIISNIIEPEEPQILKELRQALFENKITVEEFNRKINEEKMYKDAWNQSIKDKSPITTSNWENDEKDNITYVENENGKRFYSSMSPGRRQDSNFIEGNKFSFYETFELTSYEATTKLIVNVIFNDRPVKIVLEKNSNDIEK